MKAAAAAEERRPLLQKRRWRKKRRGRDGGNGVNAAEAMEGGIITASLVYMLCSFYFISFGSFLWLTVRLRKEVAE